MTKVRFHGPIAGFSGAMGDIVFADNEEQDRTVAYMKKRRHLSEAQARHQQRFKEAAAYAKAALAKPESLAFYEPIAKERRWSPQSVAIADFLNELPDIQPLDLTAYRGQLGDPIGIRTVDDVGVVDVEVTLTANDGTRIERGKAVETAARSGYWTYTATAPVASGSDIFVEVVAMDHAGNKGQMIESPRVGAED
jgi:hypothetical protein